MIMWCLINKNSGKVIKVEIYGHYIPLYLIGFARKKDVIDAIDGDLEHDEEIKRIDFTP